MDSHNSRITFGQAAVITGIFLAVRLGLLALLNTFTHGKELASDVVFHSLITSNPLAILMGTATHVASYPAFQWIIELPLYSLYKVYLSDMVSHRLVMITVEMLSLFVLIFLCNKLAIKRISIVLLALFIFSPQQYLASTMLVQEDVISQFFSLAVIAYLVSNKRLLAIATLSIAVVTAKIFFVIPLFYIVMFEGRHSLKNRLILGCIAIAPIAIVYFISISNALVNGGDVPLRDFTPPGTYGSNYWVLLIHAFPEALSTLKFVSLTIALALQVVLIGYFYKIYTSNAGPINPIVLLVLPLGVFLGTFYQLLPEYLLILWPVAGLLYNTTLQQLTIAAAVFFSWIPKLLHGLKNLETSNGTAADARLDIIKPVLELASFNADLIHQISLVANTLVYTVLILAFCVIAHRELKPIGTKQL